MTELWLVERVTGIGDYCAGCGDALEPGDLAVWSRDGGMHESCCETADDQQSALIQPRAGLTDGSD